MQMVKQTWLLPAATPIAFRYSKTPLCRELFHLTPKFPMQQGLFPGMPQLQILMAMGSLKSCLRTSHLTPFQFLEIQLLRPFPSQQNLTFLLLPVQGIWPWLILTRMANLILLPPTGFPILTLPY